MKMSREEAIRSNYMELIQYNKTLQIERRIAEGKMSESERKKYIRIFRTEVRARNGKLNSNKSKNKVKNKTLEAYYNDEKTTEIYNNFTHKIFGTNDFYRVDVALQIIETNNSLRASTKKKMCELLELINRDGYTKAKEYWIEQYCYKTFMNIASKIEELGINVLTFDKTIDSQSVGVEKIKNFTLLKNGVPEYIDPKNMPKF